MLYVRTKLDNTVSIIDPKTLKIMESVSMGAGAIAYAGAHARRVAWVHGENISH
jgi:YVTN family beta-propeller protein